MLAADSVDQGGREKPDSDCEQGVCAGGGEERKDGCVSERIFYLKAML